MLVLDIYHIVLYFPTGLLRGIMGSLRPTIARLLRSGTDRVGRATRFWERIVGNIIVEFHPGDPAGTGYWQLPIWILERRIV